MNKSDYLKKQINVMINHYGSSVDTKYFESHTRKIIICYWMKSDVLCGYWLRKQYGYICCQHQNFLHMSI